jgi:hypothetical protein
MKTTSFTYLAWLLAIGVGCAAPLRAHENDQNDNERGGDVQGDEEVQEEVALLPTASAPADAQGSAEVEADNEDGITRAKLKIEVEGLAPGTYTVSVVSAADGTTTTVLGTFPVEADNNDSDGNDGNDENGNQEGPGQAGLENQTAGEIEIGDEHGLAFPEGFNSLDIGSVLIGDADGSVVLQGDFSDTPALSKGHFTAHVKISPGPAAPAARGHVSVSSRVRRHTVRQKFLLVADNVPADVILTLHVNGQAVGQVKTTHAGKVMLKRLPAGVLAQRMTSISLEDATSSSVLDASF